jgi:Zn-dependent peptidase ImmA (M78 family)
MQDIKSVVKKLIRKHKTTDPFELCSLMGIKVIYSDLGSIRGIYQYKFRKRIVHINCNLDPYLKRQVCAHELGHAVLHRKTNTVFLDAFTYLPVSKVEIEANVFAAELLIGDIDPKDYEGYCMSEVASTLEVSEQMVEYKVKYLIDDEMKGRD